LNDRVECPIGEEEEEGRDKEQTIDETNKHEEHATVEHERVLVDLLKQLLTLISCIVCGEGLVVKMEGGVLTQLKTIEES
jgi:hypothetical protein